ncbi:SGNH/GDSL hydrolase family protein [Coleofasciculus sp. FACHB-712]|uniref:SGNH/GDSL hydrolase family protein n=1 Tax=Cyanophyceae TaxID=3028117 RepID=UPI001683E2DE|nr:MULTISPECIES: SGNH/GDSL hydrolase family protein [unclassified Coleofasciculus]MBD1893518.1 SGNH/GDSL hydrolase family protein [Coleofasciculus sp. FACHB-129]MBD1943401.1 SGNH/GDSL hydrolase family protein [Coleofasciculus sp. FACHB-712]
MKKQILATGFVLFSFLLPLKAVAASFDRIYVFGDSLSDTGNVFNLTGGSSPKAPPYYQGRFSNGPIWVDALANKLGLAPALVTAGGANSSDSINFAFGGATSGTNNVAGPLPGLQTEIDWFKSDLAKTKQSADSEALYIVWAGGNDYLGGGVTDPTEPVKNISAAVTSLFNLGARNFLVANLPDLGKAPVGLSGGIAMSNGLNQLTEFHNSGLSYSLGELSKSLDGIKLKSLDINSLFNNVITNKETFGFTNVTDSCLTNYEGPQDSTYDICDNPDSYLFWDNIHPTAAGHKLVADLAFAALTPASEPQKSVPEPASALGVLAVGALGAGSLKRRKPKKASSIKTEV